MIEIKNGNMPDISIIQHIAEKTWWNVYANIITHQQIEYMLQAIYSTRALEKIMKDNTQQFTILYEDHQPQGFSSYGLRSEDKSICKIHKFYVLPENQGRGFGKLLMEDIQKRILEKGIQTLDLNVNRLNPAKSFYEKMGFKILREEDIPIGPYWMNDYVMRWTLNH